MVQISSTDQTKLKFRKLSEPDDTVFTEAYKRFFRYASPNLFIWGPLAPAHDAIFPRTAIARMQIAIGLIFIGGSFRRFPTNIGSFRRRFSRFCSFVSGTTLSLTGVREVSYCQDPNSNPLYVEIQLARELSLLDPANGGKTNRGSYWFGPKNFMPMDNAEYWKMVYSMEVNEIMADQYLASPLLIKCKELVMQNFGGSSVNALKCEELTSRIVDVVKKDTVDQEFHHTLKNKNSAFKLFNQSGTDKTLQYWTRNNPFDALQLQGYKDFYSYVFPRLHFNLDEIENSDESDSVDKN